ncbi:MobQ family relaxase [Acinetobacter pittii]|uniref:MobQ family relaxase n=1 Tax=Acinetobacter pittii TaxID=48296 RepID=UPI003896AF8D
MAIYHFSVKAISRGAGRSAVACAAYRSGEKLVCDYYGIEQDYTKKAGVEFTNIYAPENTNPNFLDRQKLWNAVEKSERRKDALLAREFEIAFPSELNAQQRKTLLDELCQELVKKHGVIVDAAIHAPHVSGGSDERNYHAHVMFTTRAINKNGTFEAKKYRDFSRDDGTKTVTEWRKNFADLVNVQLEAIGSKERVSHLSYEDLGNGLEATQHEGYEVTQQRRRYEAEQQKNEEDRDQEIIMPDVAMSNDAIRQRNADRCSDRQEIKGLDQEITVSERLICDLREEKTDHDRKKAEAQKTAVIAAQRKLEHDRDRFIELQQQYSDFSNSYFVAENTKNQLLNTITDPEEKKRVKKEKILEIFDFIKNYDIEKVVHELKKVGEQLEKSGVPLPLPEPEKLSIWDKLKGKKPSYTHSYATISDYDEHVAPIVEKYKEYQQSKSARLERWERDDREQAKETEQLQREKQAIERENAKRYESERNQRYQSQRDFETEQPKPRPKNDFEL